MKISYDDIENAFLFVSMGQMYENQALISTQTGKIYYISEYGDSDDLPDDIEESEDYIDIPHKYELDLGKSLVFDFVSERIPDELDKVSHIFRRKGAYSRYKALLDHIGLLDEWHNYEDTRQREALLNWCSETNIEVFG